jgi:hypothetical protein
MGFKGADLAYPSMPSWFWVPGLLAIFSVIVVGATRRITTDNGPTDLQASVEYSRSIRNLFLGGTTTIPDELIHNLIPKRT